MSETKRMNVAQGTMNPVGGHRIGVVNVGDEAGRAWAKLTVIGPDGQVDARLDEGATLTVEGLGAISFAEVVEPADPERRRGAVIALDVTLEADA